MLLLVLCPGTPGGSTGNGSGFNGANGLKSHPTDWENLELTIHLKEFDCQCTF